LLVGDSYPPAVREEAGKLVSKAGWDYSLPLRRQRRDYASKSVVFRIPLFPGYLFGQANECSRNLIYSSGYVARLLEVVDQETFVSQLAVLHEALEDGRDVETVPYLEPGKRVRITSGQFRGLEGKIERYASGQRLLLSLDILQKSVAIEIDRDRLQLAD
jgi:transcriptional antiterminator NusG